jgi:hypothetical protein
MTIAGKIYQCPWCPCFFLTQYDLDRHQDSLKVTGVKPNEYDHKVMWKNIMHYRLKVEPYEHVDS